MREDAWLDLAEEAGQLREAMANRAPIEQAKGVLLVLCCTTADEAFELLKDESCNRNIKLAHLARAIVDLTSKPSPIVHDTVEPTKAHLVALDILESKGFSFSAKADEGGISA